MANQGIMHAASRVGGQPFCKARRAIMCTDVSSFIYDVRQCKRCAVIVQRQIDRAAERSRSDTRARMGGQPSCTEC